MRKIFALLSLASLSVLAPSPAQATNGDTLISVAPTARSMGGVGVAAPQDAISAIFANPAGMCLSPYCPGSQSVFAGTYYGSSAKTKVTVMGTTKEAKSDMEPFIIPAVGITAPVNNKLRFGFGAYGISGMGVDYREKDLLSGSGPDVYTQLQVMKFAPNIAYLATPNLSIGASLHVVYGALDLGQGTTHNYTLGGQIGSIYKAGPVAFGVNYTTPEKITYHKIADLDNDALGRLDTLALESPHTVTAGVAFFPDPAFLLETNVKWLNWSQADGYKDFDWQDQWVYSAGMQYKHQSGLSMRIGYNYGKSPVKVHNNFNDDPMDPTNVRNVQGKNVNTFAYEYLRIVGFPAIQEHHLTAGIGYKFTKAFEMHMGYMHAFKNKITQRGINGTVFESEIGADTVEFGLIWNYPRIMGW